MFDLGLEALESNNFTEKNLSGSLFPKVLGFQILFASSDKKELGARCSMLTALCPPIHRENGVSSKISRVNGISGRGFALYETKTITRTHKGILAEIGSSICGHKTVVQRGGGPF